MTKMVDEDLFATVCFLVLMQGNGGILGKFPSYIEEKQVIMSCKGEAYSYLDPIKQRVVLEWCAKMKLLPPLRVIEYERQSSELVGKETYNQYLINFIRGL